MRMANVHQVDDPSHNFAVGPAYLFAEHQDRGRLGGVRFFGGWGVAFASSEAAVLRSYQGTERLNGLSAAI